MEVKIKKQTHYLYVRVLSTFWTNKFFIRNFQRNEPYNGKRQVKTKEYLFGKIKLLILLVFKNRTKGTMIIKNIFEYIIFIII